MMTDIYINRQRQPKRRIPIVLVIGVVLVGSLLIWWFNREKEPTLSSTENPSAKEIETPAEKEVISPGMVSDPGRKLLAQAKAFQRQDQLQEARNICYTLINESSNQTARHSAENILSEINITLGMTPRAMSGKKEYTVQSGDTLGGISARFGTTVDLIKKGNNISGSLIRVGDRLRILQGTFSIQVDKSDNKLILYLNNRFFKRYKVGTGKYQKTPVGNFKIIERIAQPTWWRPDGKAIPYGDPENLLGTHWLSLNITGYGLHGTWEPDTIGQQASAGCVRLLNSDIEELYTLVPRETPVDIKE